MLSILMQGWAWFQAHGADVATAILMLLGAAEIIVRLTPTATDDGAVERVGKAIKNILDKLGLPNKLKEPEFDKEE